MAGVTFAEAVDYCVWLSGKTKRLYELPTEAHWEKAARTDDGRIFPWGNTWQDGRCNHSGNQPQRSLPLSRRMNMVATTWLATCANGPARSGANGCVNQTNALRTLGNDDERNDLQANDQIRRVWRGGGYTDKIRILRCAARNSQLPTSRGVPHKRCGFRVMLRIS